MVSSSAESELSLEDDPDTEDEEDEEDEVVLETCKDDEEATGKELAGTEAKE